MRRACRAHAARPRQPPARWACRCAAPRARRAQSSPRPVPAWRPASFRHPRRLRAASHWRQKLSLPWCRALRLRSPGALRAQAAAGPRPEANPKAVGKFDGFKWRPSSGSPCTQKVAGSFEGPTCQEPPQAVSSLGREGWGEGRQSSRGALHGRRSSGRLEGASPRALPSVPLKTRAISSFQVVVSGRDLSSKTCVGLVGRHATRSYSSGWQTTMARTRSMRQIRSCASFPRLGCLSGQRPGLGCEGGANGRAPSAQG